MPPKTRAADTTDTPAESSPESAGASPETHRHVTLLGLVSSFGPVVLGGEEYTIGPDGADIPVEHLDELRRVAVASRVKLRTIKV